MTGGQAAVVAQRARAKRLLLTHFGPDDAAAQENLRRAQRAFDGPVELVREGARYSSD